VPALTTEDFWSDDGGTGIYWARYEVAAAAIRKLQMESPTLFCDFNAEYYARLNADHALTPSRNLIVDIFAHVVPLAEGIPTATWIDRQRVFDCRIETGKKVWVRTQHYPNWSNYIIFQRVLFYETFPNGSEWAWWDGSQYVYHHLNGSVADARVTGPRDSLWWQGQLVTEPVQNPPEFYGFGVAYRNFSTDNDTQPWPGGDPAQFVLGMTEDGVYRFDVAFDSAATAVYRVMGESLVNTTGVYGAVLNDQGGVVYADHEGYPTEPPIPLVNGAFRGDRSWASIFNPRTRGSDSCPGRVTVRYVTGAGDRYIAYRNVDYGSQSGNQLFLLDPAAMLHDTTAVAVDPGDGTNARLFLTSAAPNPFAGSTSLRFRLSTPRAVTVRFYDPAGREVDRIASFPGQAGENVLNWRPRVQTSGVFYYELEAGDQKARGRCVLLK
jgi:hypothetical protein